MPFAAFAALAYSGRGADLLVHFQEDETSDTERYATMEAEHRFYNFKAHGHHIPPFPTVICWDLYPKPRLSVKETAKPYKFPAQLDATTLRIYPLGRMPGVFVATDEVLKSREASKAWSSNLSAQSRLGSCRDLALVMIHGRSSNQEKTR